MGTLSTGGTPYPYPQPPRDFLQHRWRETALWMLIGASMSSALRFASLARVRLSLSGALRAPTLYPNSRLSSSLADCMPMRGRFARFPPRRAESPAVALQCLATDESASVYAGFHERVAASVALRQAIVRQSARHSPAAAGRAMKANRASVIHVSMYPVLNRSLFRVKPS